MAKTKHKYRVSVYLGKDLYNEFKEMADFFGVSIASLTKMFIDNGIEFARHVDKGAKYGKQ